MGSPKNRSESRLEKLVSPREEFGPINKEVYMFAFADELQCLYRSLEDCIPDL